MTAAPSHTTPRLSCPLDAIDITGILRKDHGDLSELCDSMTENISRGLPPLIHPVVVDSQMRLISGSRRLAAHRKLNLPTIDYAFYAVLDDGERTRLEVAANYQQRFTWQEHCLAIEKYHKFYTLNANMKGEPWGIRDSARVLNMTRNPVNRCVMMAEYLHANDKEVWEAENISVAFKILIDREEKAHARLLVVQSMPGQKPATTPPPAPKLSIPTDVDDEDFFESLTGPQGGFTPAVRGPVTTNERMGGPVVATPTAGMVVPLSTMLLKSAGPRDLSVMRGLGSSSRDHIICDPPFGVPNHIETIYQGTRFADADDVADEHVASETAAMMTEFYPLAYDVLRDKGFLVMWCDPVFWWQHCVNLTAVGFKVQRWPLVWLKTSACINQAAYTNWTKNIEFAVVARKGTASLLLTQKSCVWTGGNDIETRLLGHPFAKPFGLWKWVYDAVASRGAEVLDPFVGKGSSMIPAIELGLRPVGIECSEIHYDGLVANIQSKFKSIDPNCTFS